MSKNRERVENGVAEQIGHHALMHAIDAAVPGVGMVLTAIGFMKDGRKLTQANRVAIAKEKKDKQKSRRL